MMCHCFVFALLSRSAKIVWQTMLFWGIGLLCFVATPVHAQPPTPSLVKDINLSTANANPDSLTGAGSTLYFIADDGLHGRELWKTDGSANGTMLVKDIAAGAVGSEPTELYNNNGTLFFDAKDSNGDDELWKSDGTAGGTVQVKNINPTGPSYPGVFTALNNILYFVADDGVHGPGLWRSDGTEASTVLVKTIPDTTGNKAIGFLAVKDQAIIIFAYSYNSNTIELWRSDGTEGGTILLKSISGTPQSQRPIEYTIVNGNLYFTTMDNAQTLYLWKSDGTAAGTTLVKQITAPSGSYNQINAFNAIGNTLYFLASNAPNFQPCSVWKSDGTANGTSIVTACADDWLTTVNSKLYFVGNDANAGHELWQSDGTPAGSVLLKDIEPGSGGSNPYFGMNGGGALYFWTDYGPQPGLWKSDGTAAGTLAVKSLNRGGIYTGPGDFIPFAMNAINGTVYFLAADSQLLGANGPLHGYELWKSDGTTAGTTLVKDINALTLGSYPRRLTPMGNQLYFTAQEYPDNQSTIWGQELWKTDGSAAGTLKLSNVTANGQMDPIQGIVAGSTKVYLLLDKDTTWEIWQSDGTVAGTTLVKQFPIVNNNISIIDMITAGNTLYFITDEVGVGGKLWQSDGTPAGTVMVKLVTAPNTQASQFLLAHQGIVYFDVNTTPLGTQPQIQLWRSDGTSAGTKLLKDVAPSWMVNVGNTLYFRGVASNQAGLWKSDGTPAGTAFVTPQVGDQPVVMNDVLYYNSTDSSYGSELWRSDGTAAGTTLVKDINPGPDPSGPGDGFYSGFAVVDGVLYFNAKDAAHGYGLWRSDGTTTGTTLVKAGMGYGSPYSLVAANHRLYFLQEQNNGDKNLWVSDGTAAGTQVVMNLHDSVSGVPIEYRPYLAVANDQVYFWANDFNTNFELWTTAKSALFAVSDTYVNAEDNLLTVTAPGVLGNDHEQNNAPLIATLKTNVTHGSLTLHADGSFVYSPTANFNGVDSFTYIVSNGVLSDTGIVNITVTPVNDEPVAVADNSTVMAGQAVTITVLTNDSDLDSDNLVIANVTQPTHGLVAIKGNTLVYTPTTNFTGADSFIYTINDGNGGSANATVTVNVTFNPTGDDDGDGLLNSVECPAGATCPDHDGDGIPDYQDIDSDGDGIPDATESKATNVVDAAESAVAPVDTDSDGVPDYVDTDSDNDGVPDAIEGHDANRDGVADLKPVNQDADKDGLDNVYDTVTAPAAGNATGAKVTILDIDNDKLVNWRDADDNGNGIPTRQELGADPLHPTDSNGNGIPDYLEPQSSVPSTNTHLFLPLVRR